MMKTGSPEKVHFASRGLFSPFFARLVQMYSFFAMDLVVDVRDGFEYVS